MLPEDLRRLAILALLSGWVHAASVASISPPSTSPGIATEQRGPDGRPTSIALINISLSNATGTNPRVSLKVGGTAMSNGQGNSNNPQDFDVYYYDQYISQTNPTPIGIATSDPGSGIDLLGGVGTLTASRTLAIVARNDALGGEGSETAIFTLCPDNNYVIAQGQGTGHAVIQDDDAQTPTISVNTSGSDRDAAEDDTDPSRDTAKIRFRIQPNMANPVTIRYQMSNSEAVNGQDYVGSNNQPLSGQLLVPVNTATIDLTLKAVNDLIQEPNEKATLTISPHDDYQLDPALDSSVTITIKDNDTPTVTLTSSNLIATEGGANATFTLTRAGGTMTAPLPVKIKLTSAAAPMNADPADYSISALSISPGASEGTITIPAGQSSLIFQLAASNDPFAEYPESVTLSIEPAAPGNPPAYTVGTDKQRTATIEDDEAPTISLEALDGVAKEGTSNTGALKLIRRGRRSGQIAVNLAFPTTALDAASPQDFSLTPSAAAIGDGANEATLTVTAVNDTVAEPTETVYFQVNAASGYSLGAPLTAQVTLLDDENPRVSISGVSSAGEPHRIGSFVVSRIGNLAPALTVNISKSGSTATNGTDYETVDNTVGLAADASFKTVFITPKDDQLFEGPETVVVTVLDGSGYAPGALPSGTVVIDDDGDKPRVSVTASDANATEAPGNGAKYTITRDGLLSSPLVVKFAMSGAASKGADYSISPDSQVTIAAGSANVDVTLTTNEDSDFEGLLGETAILGITSDPAYVVQTGSATVTIADNDKPTVTVTAIDASASEASGNTTGTYRISRSGNTSQQALQVDFDFSGTAARNVDYTVSANTSATIPMNQASVDVLLTVNSDEAIEPTEAAVLTISAKTTYTIGVGAGSATVQIDAAGNVIGTIAGNGSAGAGVAGPALSSPLGQVAAVAVDKDGNRYIADPDFHAVYKVTPTGTLSRLAGTGVAGFSGDGGPAASAQLNAPRGVDVDGNGVVYIADTGNHRIRRIGTNGNITTFAGTGVAGLSGNGGAATSGQLNAPRHIAANSSGGLFIADTGNNRVRKVNSDGIIIAIAGGGSNTGEGVPATNAPLNVPTGVAISSDGILYIAERGAHRVRKVGTGGNITTIAGTGVAGFAGDGGAATAALLNAPEGVAVDEFGDVFIVDSQNDRIRKLSAGVIATVAGNGNEAFTGDGGPAGSAALREPLGIDFAPNGAMYIADSANRRIRRVQAIPTGIGWLIGH